MKAKEPEWHPANPPAEDKVLIDIVEQIEEAKSLLAEGLYREKELEALQGIAHDLLKLTNAQLDAAVTEGTLEEIRHDSQS